jgi:DNA repair protein RecO (recombination protein O)
VTTHEREPVPELFALLQQGLEQLTQTTHAHMLLRLFELRLLVALGYTPQLFWCARCAREVSSQTTAFSPAFGGLVCPSCAIEVHQTLTVHPATLAYLRLVIASETETSLPLPGDPVVHQELEQVLHAHLTARLGRELKSYAFLHL